MTTVPATSATLGPRPALELLVHGVGGTTPEHMLDDPRTTRLAGDDTAGIYRRTADADAETRARTAQDAPVPEAYCWCNLTSGNGSRAMWLLLLPFMVVNLAHWMRPPSVRPDLHRVYDVLVRLIALTLTLLLVAAACEVAMDLLAWQCAGRAGCARGKDWLGFAAAYRDGWWSGPGRRLALAAPVPVLVTMLLWWLSHRTWYAYESQRPVTRGRPVTAAGAPALELPGFWYGRRIVARLRAAHTAAGLLTPTVALLTPVLVHDRRSPAPVLGAVGWALAVLVTGLATAAVAETCRSGRSEGRVDERHDHLTARLLVGGSATAYAAVTVYACWYRPGWSSAGRLPTAEIFSLITVTQGVLIAALAVTAARMRGRAPAPASPERSPDVPPSRAARPDTAGPVPRQASGRMDSPTVEAVDGGAAGAAADDPVEGSADDRVDDRADDRMVTGPAPPVSAAPPAARRPGPRGSVGCGGPPLREDAKHPGPAPRPTGDARAGGAALLGLGGPAVALLACGLGGVLSGGVAQRVADWLDRGATPGERGSSLAGPPPVLTWQASVIPVLLVVVAGLVAQGAVRLWHRRRVLSEELAVLYPGEAHQPARTRQITGAIARAGLTDSAPLLVAVVCAVAFVFGAVAVLGAWLTGDGPGVAAQGAPGPLRAAVQSAQALGSWLVGAGVLALLTLGRRAYQDASARRTIGILWDVGTFWPRAAHPFAPPCYAERAVPDLTWRMATWTESTGGRIILSGHSQGSVLAAAAVWQLDPPTRRRVALLTYGSPLERLYGRWFPAYFGPPALRSLRHEVRAWGNLWRRTDPIGGPVLVEGQGPPVDRGPLKDPAAYGRTARNPLPAPVLGHSGFQADPAFSEVRAELLARLLDGAGLPGAAADGTEAPGGLDARGAPGDPLPGHGSSGRSSG